MHTIRRLTTLLFIALLSSCGGGGGGVYGGGGGGGGGGGTANVEGTWIGYYTVTGTPGNTSVTAVIQANGSAFFYDSNGVVYVLPKLTGSTTLTGTITGYAPFGFTFGDGKTQDNYVLAGAASDTVISGTFGGNSNGVTGSFYLTPFTAYNQTPTIVSGFWNGFYVGSSAAGVSLTVQPSGTFVGTDGNGCNLSGSLTQVQSGENLFTVSVDSTGSSSSCYGHLTGLAFESNHDYSGAFGGTLGTYYYAGVSNTSGAFVAELKAP